MSWDISYRTVDDYPSESIREPQHQLKRARTTGTEDLGGPGRGLSEAAAGEISAITGEVRFVVQVERLADNRQVPAPVIDHRVSQAKVHRVIALAKRVARRDRQAWNRAA